jgi:hypothetical protein
MSRFREELRIIPATAKWIAALVGPAAGVALGVVMCLPPGDVNRPPIPVRILLSALLAVVIAAIILLDGYIYGDARRRGMRHVMWTLLAIFIPDGIGIILYFILRDPMPIACPACAAPVLAKFTFCPRCGSAVRPTCPACGRAVEYGWSNCAYCGGRLPLPHTHNS